MAARVACLAPDSRRAEADARALAGWLERPDVEAFSLLGYAGDEDPPRRIVLCPAGRTLSADLSFLRRAAWRLLWPAPPDGFRAAIGGIREHRPGPHLAHARPRRAVRRATGGLATALLLEGPVGPERALAALASAAARHWIVESARQVRLPAALHAELARQGVRWSALEPIEVVALYATPALAKASARWKTILPRATPVWIRD